MPDRNASLTAFGVAYVRAAHQLLDARPLVFEDPVALKLLGPAAHQRINEASDMYQSLEWRSLRARVVLRSRFSEDRLASAIGRGVTQYVILGAGFDTFALRQPAWARSLRILEVDHEGTQRTKRQMIEAAGIAVPGNSRFATIDFEKESLQEGLLRHRVSLDQPTFFSWLGVTMYLPEEAVDAMLRSVATFPPGSEIVLTFLSADDGSPTPLGRERAASIGEPWLSFFEPETIEQKLRAAGFSEIEFLSPQAAEARYFCDRPQDLPVPQATNLVSAML